MSNVVTIIKPEGKYTILYGMHMRSQDPKDLPDDVGAVILETGTTKYLQKPEESIKQLKEHVQYKEFIKVLESRRISLVFVDVKYRFNDYGLLLADNAIAGIESMHGWRLLRNFKVQSTKFKNTDQKSKKEQRVFEVMLGGWLVLPFVANGLRMLSMFTGRGLKQSSALKKLSHKLHPEVDFLYLTLRNVLIAEKERFIMSLLGTKAHIATVLGAGHVGIEDMLKMTDEKRLENIKALLPIIKKIVQPEYFYKAVQYVYNDTKWEVERVIEINHLKVLL